MPSRTLCLLLSSCLAAACGGGGDSAPPPGTPLGAVPGFESALDFQWPDTFVNGRAYSTERAAVSVQGELNSVFIPRGYCPEERPPQNFRVEWRNEATGGTGTAVIAIGCVTNTLFGIELDGIASSFQTESFDLALGQNRIVFDTYQGTQQLGRDAVTIVREDRVAPKITFSYPRDGAQGIATNHAVLISFDEAMAEATLTGDRFTVEDGSGTPVSGQLFYDADDFVWLFRPDGPLASSATYTVTLSGNVEDAGGANALGADVTWTFDTGADADQAAPAVESHWPGAACDCAPVSTRILASFDETIEPSTSDGASIVVTDGSATPVSGTTLYRGDYLEFLPDEPLQAGLTYTATVIADVGDLAGNALGANDVWQFTTDVRAPAGAWRPTSDLQAPAATAYHSAVWTGNEAIFWGWQGGGRYDALADSWSGISPSAQPAPRRDHSAVWTGNEMIIWGGRDGAGIDSEALSTGGRYAPSTDTWIGFDAPEGTASSATYDHVAVWTGTEMIVWGGSVTSDTSSAPQPVDTGWRFYPTTDTFASFRGLDVPAARYGATAVWTGNEMIVWGGIDANGSHLNDGARYDPVADAWTPLPAADPAIVAGPAISAVWTGTEMIVWNGGQTVPEQQTNDQRRVPTLRFYNPTTDSWRASTSGWEPFLASADPLIITIASSGYIAHWTGDRMFALGLYPGDDGFLYDPIVDDWQRIETNIWVRLRGSASVWAGDRFVTWGGVGSVLPVDEGWVFEP